MSNPELKECPLCDGECRWCDDNSPLGDHGCHLIVCEQCKCSFDCAGDDDPETLDELKAICANRFNNREV